MQLSEIISIIWHRRWTLLSVLGVTLLAAIAGTFLLTPKFDAQAVLRVATVRGGSLEYVNFAVDYTDRLMNTYARIGTSRPVLDTLQAEFGLVELPDVTVGVLINTELLEIKVRDENPILAADMANRVAEILIAGSQDLLPPGSEGQSDLVGEQLAELDKELTAIEQQYDEVSRTDPTNSARLDSLSKQLELKQSLYTILLQQEERNRVRDVFLVNTLSVVEPAYIPEKPTIPSLPINLGVGLLLGLVGGIGLAFLQETFQRSQEQVQNQITEQRGQGRPTENGQATVLTTAPKMNDSLLQAEQILADR